MGATGNRVSRIRESFGKMSHIEIQTNLHIPDLYIPDLNIPEDCKKNILTNYIHNVNQSYFDVISFIKSNKVASRFMLSRNIPAYTTNCIYDEYKNETGL